MSTIDWVACERLIGNLASKFAQDGLDLDDLKQEARIAVLESYAEYKPELGISLSTFLGRRIRDALRKYSAHNLDIIEVSREWVSESIVEGPHVALRAKTKEGCEALRSIVGPNAFRKPRRVVETMRVTVSFDECSGESDEDSTSLHDRLGTGPGQEAMVLANRQLTATKEVQNDAAKAGGHGGDWSELLTLRSEGWTLAEIAARFGKSPQAVHQALSRAQKRLSKKRAA